jgi:hypothetical protein
MKHRNMKISLAIASILICGIAQSQPIRTGRSVALAGAGALGMYGSQAESWNPANLGLKANPAFSLTIASFSFAMGNNAFSPQYISDTFQKGNVLDSAKKQEILDKMTSDQWKLYAQVGAPVLGLSFEQLSFNVDFHAMESAAMPAELFDLALKGNLLDRAYDFNSVDQYGMAYWTISVSAAKPFVPPPMFKELSVGATFKYVSGTAYSELAHREGTLLTTNSSILFEDKFQLLKSSKGDGAGLDLAAAGRLEFFDLYTGIMLGNIFGDITWANVECQEFTKTQDTLGVNMDSMSNSDYWRNHWKHNQTTYSSPSVSSPLPRYLMLSLDKAYLNGRGDLFFNYFQGLNSTPSQNTTPKVSIGSEFRWIPVLPLRAGISLGGIEGSEFSGGFGFKMSGYQFNFGASWQRGILAGAKGFSIAFTNYFGQGFEREGL